MITDSEQMQEENQHGQVTEVTGMGLAVDKISLHAVFILPSIFSSSNLISKTFALQVSHENVTSKSCSSC